MNRTYHLPVCEDHQLHLSFVKDYKMPKHWLNRSRCAKTNCTKDADHWLVIEVTEEVFGGGPSPRKLTHIQEEIG